LTEFPGVSPGGYWFWFDLPVAYDPCICNNYVAIEMSGKLIKKASFTATGSLLGTIQSITTPSSSDYSNLVLKKVIGAGTALGTAIATKGAVVQTDKFIDLVDVIVNKPNIPTNEKKEWEMFSKFLSASNNLTRKDGKWVDWVTNDTLGDKDVVKMMGSINTFVSSAMDLNKKGGGGKSVSTVNGKINLTGSVTTSLGIQSAPYWSVPGSGLSLNSGEEVSNIPNSAKKNPEYPLYNEVLGTVAILKTPKLKLNISRIWEFSKNQYSWGPDPNNPSQQIKEYWSNHGFKIRGYLPEDLSFAVIPKMHLNLEKTKISAFVTVEFGESLENWNWELMNENKIPLQFKMSMNPDAIEDKNPMNMEYSTASKTLSSTPVDLDEFRELFFQGRIITTDFNSLIEPLNPSSDIDIATGYMPQVFLKLYFEFESYDIGSDGKPVRTTQLISIPFEAESFDDSFPFEKHNTVTKETIDLLQPGGINYNSNEIIYAKNINVLSDLSTSNGTEVIIRATEHIYVSPGVEIGPGINLEIKETPFSGIYPQNPKTSSYLTIYCAGNTSDATYRANQWANKKINTSTITDSSIHKNSKKVSHKALEVFPVPAINKINIEIEEGDSEVLVLQLIDATGSIIETIPPNYRSYDISQLSGGIYFIKVLFSDGDSQMSRFVKVSQ